MQLLGGSKIALVGCGDNELGVVNETTVVSVDSLEHLLDFGVGHNSTVVFKISLLYFFHGKFAVTILVESLEDFGKVVAFLLAHKLGSDEGVGSLFESNITVKATQVVESRHSHSLINLKGSKFGDPWVSKGL